MDTLFTLGVVVAFFAFSVGVYFIVKHFAEGED